MSKRVLIVENNVEQLHRLKELVKAIDKDVWVCAVTNADAATDILSNQVIDVFLCNVTLDSGNAEDVSGMDLVGEIRKIEKYLFTPVIFITERMDFEEEAYRDLHCYGYIGKPFNTEEITQTVKKALKYTTQRDVKEYVYFQKDGLVYPVKCKDIPIQ